MENSQAVQGGLELGSAAAMILSWSANHSVGWMLAHAFCSWFYVVYFAIWK